MPDITVQDDVVSKYRKYKKELLSIKEKKMKVLSEKEHVFDGLIK